MIGLLVVIDAENDTRTSIVIGSNDATASDKILTRLIRAASYEHLYAMPDHVTDRKVAVEALQENQMIDWTNITKQHLREAIVQIQGIIDDPCNVIDTRTTPTNTDVQ